MSHTVSEYNNMLFNYKSFCQFVYQFSFFLINDYHTDIEVLDSVSSV